MTHARRLALIGSLLLFAACSGAAPGLGGGTQPTGAAGQPTAQGGGGGGAPAGGICSTVTADEMSQIMGTPMVVGDASSASECTYTATAGLPVISLRLETSDLTTARTLLGQTATDVTVAGHPGVIGNFMGVILYVTYGAQDLVVQAALQSDTPTNRSQLIAVATKAFTRLP
jgi:hypothetical protein